MGTDKYKPCLACDLGVPIKGRIEITKTSVVSNLATMFDSSCYRPPKDGIICSHCENQFKTLAAHRILINALNKKVSYCYVFFCT